MSMSAEHSLTGEKLRQAQDILRELGIDLWLTFVRESAHMPDPALEIVVGTHVTWQTAFLVPAQGRTHAIVGSLDAANVREKTPFDDVTGYVQSIREPLLAALNALVPRQIALNYSKDSEIADGLSHGLFLLLEDYLAPTPFAGRFVSSGPILAALRGRKTPLERERLAAAVRETLAILDEARAFVRPGLSERDVARFILERVAARGLETSWAAEQCPAVFTGPQSPGAHAEPSDRRIEPGHVVNIDFGVRVAGYCADLQRTFYILRPDETRAPDAVQRGFDTIVAAISKSAEALRPGVMGHAVDAVARGHIVAAGYPEYPHALGHQIGRQAHDGSGLLCPEWERYGGRPYEPVEAGQVYTLEPRLPIPDAGVATIEEEVLVTAAGAEFLGPRQTELWLVAAP